MVRAAYASIFSELVREKRLQVVKEFKVDSPKTKEVLGKLTDLKAADSAYVIVATEAANENLYLSVRNLSYVDVSEVGGIDPVSLIKYDHVVITEEAVKEVEEWLAA